MPQAEEPVKGAEWLERRIAEIIRDLERIEAKIDSTALRLEKLDEKILSFLEPGPPVSLDVTTTLVNK